MQYDFNDLLSSKRIVVQEIFLSKNIDHIVITTVDGFLNCVHCGDRYDHQKALPASINMSIAIINQFKEDHIDCKLSEEGTELAKDNFIAFENARIKFTATRAQLYTMLVTVASRRGSKFTQEEFDDKADRLLRKNPQGCSAKSWFPALNFSIHTLEDIEDGYYIFKQDYTRLKDLLVTNGAKIL